MQPSSGGGLVERSLDSDPVITVPDLIMPIGNVELKTVREVAARIETGPEEWVDVLLPAETPYQLKITKVFRARWVVTPTAARWNFLCEISGERVWIEFFDSRWHFNHDLDPSVDDSKS